MNDHAEIQKRLSAYCGEDLEAAERQRVERHLAECPECRAELAELQTVQRLIRSTAEVEPPPWLAARVMARIREQQAGKRSWLQRLFFPLQVKLPLEAVALLLVCVSGYYLTRSVETDLQQARQQLQESPAQTAPAPIPTAVQPPGRADRAKPLAVVPPAAAPQIAPRPESTSVQPAPETSSVPAPAPSAPSPALRDQPGGKAETMKAAPAAESGSRGLDSAPEKKEKYSRSLERRADQAAPAASGRAAGAPTGLLLPQAVVRLNVTDPATAAEQIRATVLRSGGSVVDQRTPPGRRLLARIPPARQNELLDQLERLGRIMERPAQPSGGAALLELTIEWQ